MEAVQCNQPATRLLADHLREWHYNSVLVFAAGSGSSQCGVGEGKSAAEPMHNLHLFHRDHRVYKPIEQRHKYQGKEAGWYTQNR